MVKTAKKKASVKGGVAGAAKKPDKKTAKKTTTKKKAVAKKKTAGKKPAVAREAAARQTVARRSPAKSGGRGKSPLRRVSTAERHQLIAEAAYLRSEAHGFFGDARQDWLAAEAEIDARLSKAGILVDD